MKALLLIALAAFIGFSNAQNQVVCQFFVIGLDYDCIMQQSFIPDNEAADIQVLGNHVDGRNNAGVTRVVITNSFHPFVIRQFFTTFPNLVSYQYSNSIASFRIPAGAFANAANLRTIAITGTLLNSVPNNAFQGAPNVETLNLNNNFIGAITELMFGGVAALRTIDLSSNDITTVHDAALRQLSSLTTLNLNDNLIRRLPTNFVLTNFQLTNFYANNNEILEIGRRFLDPVGNLNSLQLASNVCINGMWVNIGGPGGPTKDSIRAQLENCFLNYGDLPTTPPTTPGPPGTPAPGQQDFRLELRGSMRLYDLERDPNTPVLIL